MKNIKKLIEPELVSIRDIFKDEKIYKIPLYQRKYDWEQNNIDILIETFVRKYKDENKNYIFLGNMEFKKIDNNTLQIVDSQQRMTTFLILFYQIAKEQFTKEKIMKIFKIKNSEEKQEVNEETKFRDFLEKPYYTEDEKKEIESLNNKRVKNKKIQELKNSNIYRLNNYYIEKALERNADSIEDYEDFVQYLLDNVYVVQILLNEGISENESIEIFNSINTTGKPLDTKDIFKIRMYEYNKKYGNDKDILNDINNLYNKIEKENEKISKIENEIGANRKEYSLINFISESFNMDDILKVYKYILISRMAQNNNEDVNYRSELFKMSNSRFYDNLFRKILNDFDINKFNRFENNCIRYEEIEELCNKYVEIAEIILEMKKIKPETYFNYKMLKSYTRYSSTYNFLPVLYLWKFKKINKEFDIFIDKITNLFEVYSVVNYQVIDDVKTFINNHVIMEIVNSNGNEKEVVKKIELAVKNKILELNNKNDIRLKRGKDIIEGEIANNGTVRSIACLILAKKAEEKEVKRKDLQEKENKELLKSYQKLFTRKFDIEHIYAKEDKKSKLTDVEKNQLGNLTILEYSINRNLKDKPIEKKILKYADSEFAIVTEEIQNYKKSHKNKQKSKVEIVEDYLFRELKEG